MPSFKRQMEKQGSEPQIWGLESSPNRLAVCIQSQRNTCHSGNRAGTEHGDSGVAQGFTYISCHFALWHPLPHRECDFSSDSLGTGQSREIRIFHVNPSVCQEAKLNTQHPLFLFLGSRKIPQMASPEADNRPGNGVTMLLIGAFLVSMTY